MTQKKIPNKLSECSLPSGWSLERDKNQSPFIRTKEGLVFRIDFSEKKPLLRKQPLVRALGFKGQKLKVLDITAGWAQEAFLISKMGCFVTAIEQNPFVFYFVQESLKQQGFFLPQFHFILDNSFNYLNNINREDKPDVIYMDPMFEIRKKSLSQKSLKILRELTGETKNKKKLLDLALQKARQRVVVKRRALEAPLKAGSLCFFQGRSVCFDVFKAI